MSLSNGGALPLVGAVTLALPLPRTTTLATRVGALNLESIMRASSLEVLVPEQKGEWLGASDCHIGNVGSRSNVSVATATTTGRKRIEVCMGGKCKKSGGGASDIN
ncbi:hypothetical protein KY290_009883 [Solanum tuberosum]|uniref:Uncharacterized protein n=1 Tax=Solanum tuberosum TaxID=4113 RepID=A0ABQ7VW68_SOLTU|nr:hypothetical protein KY289_010266 [Solanum tuberosum]KAH0708417.1 hypothetical protein KY284_009844 [Solanum tuberosum]KAH0772746.1 hypothetical protein KY290_009883 [Solanum tuberosum]